LTLHFTATESTFSYFEALLEEQAKHIDPLLPPVLGDTRSYTLMERSGRSDERLARFRHFVQTLLDPTPQSLA
jgi:hypothetical protein